MQCLGPLQLMRFNELCLTCRLDFLPTLHLMTRLDILEVSHNPGIVIHEMDISISLYKENIVLLQHLSLVGLRNGDMLCRHQAQFIANIQHRFSQAGRVVRFELSAPPPPICGLDSEDYEDDAVHVLMRVEAVRNGLEAQKQ